MAKVKLFAPEGTAGCSFEGVGYDAAEDGTVEVPEAAVEALQAHGFATSREQVGKPPEVSKESFADLAQKLTEAKVEAEHLRGSVEAVRGERDALSAKVSELEKQLAAGKRGK